MAGMENALGAPTEGLGQTVTFALKGIDSAPSIDTLGPAALHIGVTGGQSPSFSPAAAPIAQPEDRTFGLLMKVADKMMTKQIDKERKAAFVTGMQKARAGATLLDIAAEQPWYTKIFGESDVVSGARAYTQQNVAQNTVLALQEQMPDLRTKGLDEARGVFNAAIDKAMTGDAETDAFLMQSFSRTMPSLMAQHTREHYKYTQEQAVETQGKALNSAAKLLQSQGVEHAENDSDPAEYEAAKEAYIGLTLKPAGMNDESYFKSLSQHMMAAAENGDFHAISALREAGALDVLPEAYRRQVLRTIDTNERSLPAGPQGEQFAERLYGLRRMAHQISVNDGPIAGPEVLRAGYAKLNSDYMRITGSSLPMVGKNAVTSESVQMEDEIRQALDRDHRERLAAAKEAAREAKINGLLSAQAEAAKVRARAFEDAWDKGIPSALLFGPDKAKEDEIDVLINGRMHGIMWNGDPALSQDARVKTAYRTLGDAVQNGAGDKLVRATFTQQYNAAVAQGVGSPMWASVYENFRRLKENAPDALGHVFDEKQLKTLNLFNAMHPGGMSKETMPIAMAAFATAVDPNTKLPKMALDKKEGDALLAQVAKDKSFILPEMMGGEPDLHPSQVARIANTISPSVEQLLQTGVGMESATKQSWGSYTRAGGKVIGGYAFMDRGAKDTGLEQLLKGDRKDLVFGIEAGNIGRGFKNYVRAQVAKVGNADPKLAQIVPVGDGKHFHILTTDREGQPAFIAGLPYADIGAFIAEQAKVMVPENMRDNPVNIGERNKQLRDAILNRN